MARTKHNRAIHRKLSGGFTREDYAPSHLGDYLKMLETADAIRRARLDASAGTLNIAKPPSLATTTAGRFVWRSAALAWWQEESRTFEIFKRSYMSVRSSVMGSNTAVVLEGTGAARGMTMQLAFARRLGCAVAVILVSLLSTGCSGALNRGDGLSTACPKVDMSGDVPLCTRLFDKSAGVRLPANTADQPFGAISRSGQFFIDSRGERFGLEPAKRPPETIDRSYATTVYRAKVVDGVATSLEPILRVTEEAILTHTFGGRVLSGTISARQADGSYDVRPNLPVVIRLADHAAKGALYGSIVNADRAVRIGTGRCVPTLPGTFDNPLVDGYSSNVSLRRSPSMHLLYGDQLVLHWSEDSSGMGDAFYPSVATVMGADPISKKWRVVQHGNPTSGPALNLQLTDGAIKTC